jgi:ABC-2 type transport system ATP-binding protein
MNGTLIRTDHLTRDFTTTSKGRIRAVDHLSLEIPSGIVFGFLGPNGSGKTTTIRLLLGLLEPTEGRAEVFGYDTRTQSAQIREQTGALLEHTGLYERLTAEDNLEFYGRVYHIPNDRRQARIRELLENMGLWERRKEVVGGWSRGMKQKLAVARALMHNPKLIFLDEPTSGLDPVAAAALRDDLARLVSDFQVTVFLTTHNLTDAEKLCQQVAVIRTGKLLALGAPQELAQRDESTQAEIYGQGFTPTLLEQVRARPEVTSLGEVNNHLVLTVRQGTGLAPIVTQLVMGGAQLEEVRKNKASLEEVFLDLVDEESK